MNGNLPGVTLPAWREGEFVPLIELMLVVGRWILGASWHLRNAEFATGWRGSSELNVMSSQVNPTPTVALVDLVSDGVQMIGGELLAFRPGEAEAFLAIRSIRGDEWDVRCADRALLYAVREVFGGTCLPPESEANSPS